MADKKVIIINHNGQLGNQLWNYAAVYAYCLEKGYGCANPAFYQYVRYFPACRTGLLPRLFFGRLFQHFPKKRFSISRLYNLYLRLRFGRKKLARAIQPSDNGGSFTETFFLPPSKNTDQQQKERLRVAEAAPDDIIFSGYAFRNPDGLIRYHEQVRRFFSPRPNIRVAGQKLVNEARKKYGKIVGVHIRQNDYRTFQNGAYYFTPESVAMILKDFSAQTGLSDACFIIASDEKIAPEIFAGLNFFFSSGKILDDLFTLAQTDLIIGTNSTFGAFAAYYADVPLIIFSKESIDWNYYLNQKNFTFV